MHVTDVQRYRPMAATDAMHERVVRGALAVRVGLRMVGCHAGAHRRGGRHVPHDAPPPSPRARGDLRAARPCLRDATSARRWPPRWRSRATAPERVRRGLEAVCAVSEHHLAFLRGLDEEADTRLFHVGRVSRAGFVGPLERVLRDGMRDGSLRPVPVRADGHAPRQRRRPDVPASACRARLVARAVARGDRPAGAGDLNPAVTRAGPPRRRPRASRGRVRASARPRRGPQRSPG